MRRLFFDVVAVLLTVAALSGVAVVDATQEYVILRNACKRSSSTQDTCDQTLAKDRELLLAMCRDQGLYPGLILNETDRRKVMSLMDSKGISRVYVGARRHIRKDGLHWCWLSDLWSSGTCSTFYLSGSESASVAYGPIFWLTGFPKLNDEQYVVFLHTSVGSGLRNVDGSDDEPFDVLCETTRRELPMLAGKAAYVDRDISPRPPTTRHRITAQPPAANRGPLPPPPPTSSRRPIPPPPPTSSRQPTPPPPPTIPHDSSTSQNHASMPEPPPTETNATSSPTGTGTAESPTGTATTSSPVSSASGEFPTWAIGVIIGVLVLMLIIILGVCACCYCGYIVAK